MDNQNNSLHFKELFQPAVVVSFLEHKPLCDLAVCAGASQRALHVPTRRKLARPYIVARTV